VYIKFFSALHSMHDALYNMPIKAVTSLTVFHFL